MAVSQGLRMGLYPTARVTGFRGVGIGGRDFLWLVMSKRFSSMFIMCGSKVRSILCLATCNTMFLCVFLGSMMISERYEPL